MRLRVWVLFFMTMFAMFDAGASMRKLDVNTRIPEWRDFLKKLQSMPCESDDLLERGVHGCLYYVKENYLVIQSLSYPVFPNKFANSSNNPSPPPPAVVYYSVEGANSINIISDRIGGIHVGQAKNYYDELSVITKGVEILE